MTGYVPAHAEDDPMNQTEKKVPQYHIPEGASPGVRAWIQQAQERLERFANSPEHRQAYECELLERLEHNSLLEERHAEGFAEGREEGREATLKLVIKNLRHDGFDDEFIIRSLQLTPEEQRILLSTPSTL